MDDLAKFPLLQKIQDAINTHGNRKTGIRISISKDIQKIRDKKTGEIALTRALCWNLVNSRNKYLTDPILAVVSSHINEETIKKDLHMFFADRNIIVDNDIYVDDEE